MDGRQEKNSSNEKKARLPKAAPEADTCAIKGYDEFLATENGTRHADEWSEKKPALSAQPSNNGQTGTDKAPRAAAKAAKNTSTVDGAARVEIVSTRGPFVAFDKKHTASTLEKVGASGPPLDGGGNGGGRGRWKGRTQPRPKSAAPSVVTVAPTAPPSSDVRVDGAREVFDAGRQSASSSANASIASPSGRLGGGEIPGAWPVQGRGGLGTASSHPDSDPTAGLSRGSDGSEEVYEEGEALSAYVVPERERDALGAAVHDYEGVIIPDDVGAGAEGAGRGDGSAQEREEERHSPSSGRETAKFRRRSRRRRRCIGAVVLVGAVAGAILAAVLVATRTRQTPSEANDQERGSSTNDTRPVVDLPPIADDATSVPSAPPSSSERFMAIRSSLRSTLSSHGLTAEVLDDPTTPQGRALEWLAYEDGHRVDPENDEFGVAQRFALATLYYSTGGQDSWIEDCNFLSSEHECLWNQPGTDLTAARGISFPFIGVTECIEGDLVLGILLPKNNLTGTIPPEIALFRNVTYVHFGGNNLSGPIPTILLNLPHLRYLLMSDNNFTGPIPDHMGGPNELENIHLHVNTLNSTIPSSFGKLRNLTTLFLGHNVLTGPVPTELATLQELDTLFLDNNLLSAWDFPSGGSLSKLQLLSARSNLFPSIPPEIFASTNLTLLFLNDNYISATLPSDLALLTRLESLDVGYNYLNGTIPSAIFGLERLQGLNIGLNDFSGTVHSSIGSLTNLSLLVLGNNNLSGSIPDAIGELLELRRLGLSHCNFTGQIPKSLSNLSSLETLTLQNNSLSGSLDFLCDSRNDSEVFLMADCVGANPEVNCSCCSACCSDNDNEGPVYGCYPPS